MRAPRSSRTYVVQLAGGCAALALLTFPSLASADPAPAGAKGHGPLVHAQGETYYEPTREHPWTLPLNTTISTWVVSEKKLQQMLDKLPGDVRARGLLGHTVVNVMANDYKPGGNVSPNTAAHGYRETLVAIPVRVRDSDGKEKNAFYVPTLDVSDQGAVVAGKEVYGYNKHLEDVRYKDDGKTVDVRSPAQGSPNFLLNAKRVTGPVGAVAGVMAGIGMRVAGMTGPGLHALTEKDGQLVVGDATLTIAPTSVRVAKPTAADARQLVDMNILTPKQAAHPAFVVAATRGTYAVAPPRTITK
jgi:hypothetical protein